MPNKDATTHTCGAGETTSDAAARVPNPAEWVPNAEVAASTDSDGDGSYAIGANTSLDAPRPCRGETPTEGTAAQRDAAAQGGDGNCGGTDYVASDATGRALRTDAAALRLLVPALGAHASAHGAYIAHSASLGVHDDANAAAVGARICTGRRGH